MNRCGSSSREPEPKCRTGAMRRIDRDTRRRARRQVRTNQSATVNDDTVPTMVAAFGAAVKGDVKLTAVLL
jgi:hypothetical protein